MNRSERIARLRQRAITIPAVCLERAKYYTESYRQTEALPTVLRRAMAVSHVLDHMAIHIYEDELIVGCHTGKVRGGMWLPEINGGWLLDELDTVQDRVWEKYQPLSPEEKELARELFTYWEGRTLADQWRALVDPQFLAVENIVQSGGYAENCHYPGHFCLDYKRVVELGLEGSIADLDLRIAAIDPADPDELDRLHFYQAARLVQQAVIRFAGRYAALAEELARTAGPERRAELLRIAEICRRVPAKPARTFQEGIQSCWLMSIAAMIECCGAGVSLGRCDQYLYPLYRDDLASGRLTREQAKDLMSMLLIKMNDVTMLQAGFLQVGFSGYPVMQGLTIGGVDAEGRDAVNGLSYLILDSEEEVGLTAEELVIRISGQNPDEYVVRACEVARNLSGKLKFVSDDSTIAALVQFGLPEELARDYISCGCHCPMVPAVNQISAGVIFNYPLMLELALNNGVHRQSGLQLGPRTGDPAEFSSLADIEDAFERQFEALYRPAMAFKNADMYLYDTQMPCPLISSFYGSCLERGDDFFHHGIDPYAGHVTGICGLPNIADSLAAIQKVVFEDKAATMAELSRALAANFEGCDELLRSLRAAPKFGNDLDEVDLIARRVLLRSSKFVCEHHTWNGRKCAIGCIGMTVNIPYGEILGAMPDGRLAGEPLSEGGISPYPGRNVSGITAVLNSVAKVDHDWLENGSILNVRIAAGACSTPDKLKKLAALVRVFCRKKGSLIQFNFTGTETLLDAQKHPERYKDLLVRVATYSSYFVELSTALQDNIISRTAMDL